MYCIVLYCIVLYCIVLYCIVLYCIVLYCIVLYCIVLYCIVLYCIVLYCIVLYCIVSHRIASHCIASHCIALHCIALLIDFQFFHLEHPGSGEMMSAIFQSTQKERLLGLGPHFIIDDTNNQINSSVYVADEGHYYAKLIKIHIHLIALIE